MDVAWIGLGQMGLPTSKKIAAAGHRVVAYDVIAPAPGAAEGLVLAASPREAAEGCDLLCLAVFSDAQVAEVLTGPDGVLNRLKPGAIVAIFTTGSIEAVQALAASAPPGIAILDTCFSKMHAQVQNGTMTLLVGGDADAITRGRPVFDAFASDIVHVGASGAGRAIKLVNNILFAGHLQLAADALRMAEGLKLEPRATALALSKCSGESDILRRCAEDDIQNMLDTAQRYMVKDVNAAADAARKAGVQLGALAAATSVYVSG